jgi:hypothetical protein
VPRRIQNALQNFAAGVLSPRYSAAIESGAFPRALQSATNFIISSQGGAAFREGFEYIVEGISNQKFRVFQFHRGGDESDILIEVGEGSIRYWGEEQGRPTPIVDNLTILTDEDDGFLLVDEDGNFLSVGQIISANPYEVEDMDNLYFTNQGTYGIICSNRHPPLYITSSANGLIFAELLDKGRIPNFSYNDVNSPRLESQAANWRISFPSSWTNSQFVYRVGYNNVYADITYNFDPSFSPNNALNIKDGLEQAAAKLGFTTTFLVVDSDILTYDVTVGGSNAGWNINIVPVYGAIFIPIALPPLAQPQDIGGDPDYEPAWSYPCMVYQPLDSHYYQCIQTHRASADNEPGNPAALPVTTWQLYWDDLGIAVPDGWDYQYPTGNDWTLGIAPGTIYSPMNRGFPTVAVFHEQRLILMANKDNPTAIYGSAIGAFTSFTPGPNDDQPFLYILDSSDTPQIKWARSQKNLTLGTSSGEWAISADVTITPTDISAAQQNNSRSHLTMPAQFDVEIFYIEQGMRKLKSTQYNDGLKTFNSVDVSLMAEHLISTIGINRVAVSTVPETLFTMTRNDGQPVYLTYEKAAQVLAFSECQTDAFVYDVCSFFSLDKNWDYTFYAVERNNRWVLERMRYPICKETNSHTDEGIVFMDGWVTGTVSGDTITDLGHLEAKQVYVLVDEAWQIGEYIVTNGLIRLDKDYTGRSYAVGLPYTGQMETFEVNTNPNGVGLGTKRRWNRLTTRVLNSALPEVFSERAYDRRPQTPMGTSDNVIAGIHNITQNNVGFGDGSISVVMDRPYPVYVIGFYGQYEVEER